VIYVHDLPMPELLTHSKAVVTINSTAGISALIHNKPLKVMGRALYDIKGITYQGHLNQFWTSGFKPDMKLFKQFRLYLLKNTQINAVYYGGNKVDIATAADTQYHPVFISQKLIMNYIKQQPS
jgi:capsular polysaccharide export protein